MIKIKYSSDLYSLRSLIKKEFFYKLPLQKLTHSIPRNPPQRKIHHSLRFDTSPHRHILARAALHPIIYTHQSTRAKTYQRRSSVPYRAARVSFAINSAKKKIGTYPYSPHLCTYPRITYVCIKTKKRRIRGGGGGGGEKEKWRLVKFMRQRARISPRGFAYAALGMCVCEEGRAAATRASLMRGVAHEERV